MRRRAAAVLMGMAALGLVPGRIARPDEPKPTTPGRPDRLDEALWWLPPDTETILFARGPWRVDVADRDRGDVPHEGDDRLDVSFRAWISGLAPEQRPGTSRIPTVAFALEGSRHFRSPKDLGLMPYQGAHIVVFERPLGAAAAAVERALGVPGLDRSVADDPVLKRERIGGHEVLSYDRKLNEDIWTMHVTRPRPDVLIVATDRGYLAELLGRMSRKGATRAMPDSLPEWKHLDASRPIWGLRHYDRKAAVDDPTSPLAGGERAANTPDDRAIGLVFTIDAGKDGAARVEYLSTNPNAPAIARDAFASPEEGVVPRIRRAGPDVVEISFAPKEPKDGDWPNSLFRLLLLQAIGHAVYL